MNGQQLPLADTQDPKSGGFSRYPSSEFGRMIVAQAELRNLKSLVYQNSIGLQGYIADFTEGPFFSRTVIAHVLGTR